LPSVPRLEEQIIVQEIWKCNNNLQRNLDT
jgi:hypothetical protein